MYDKSNHHSSFIVSRPPLPGAMSSLSLSVRARCWRADSQERTGELGTAEEVTSATSTSDPHWHCIGVRSPGQSYTKHTASIPTMILQVNDYQY